jgi:PAS domain S-box-containing protein
MEKFPQFKSKGVCNIEFEMKHKNGSAIFVEFNGRISYDENGNFQRTHCIFQDISRRKKMEDMLQFQADILKNIKDCIIVYDLQGKVIYWNDGAENVYGYSKEEIMGKSIDILYPIKDKDKLKRDINLTQELGEYIGEWEGKRKDGSKIVVNIREALMHDANGEIIGIIGISRHIAD